jgi:hypothetical protein
MLVEHCTDVDDDQDAVTQFTDDAPVECVKSRAPKLRPVTVIDEAPVRAAFSCAAEAMGASKLNKAGLVPLTAPTVRCALSVVEYILDVSTITAVDDVHVTVCAIRKAIIMEAVNMLLPKLSPVTVTVDRPVPAEFS